MSRAEDPLTYRAPRSMQEAFGPYTDHQIQNPEKPPLHPNDKVTLIACAVALICSTGLWSLGLLK